MASTSYLGRLASAAWIAGAACVLVFHGGADAQSTFDPYNPSTGQYRENVTPSYPSNLALPGQARQAKSLNREAVYGTRVDATPFERFMRDGYDDIFAPSDIGSDALRSRAAPGVPYYRAGRDAARDYVPNREADKNFNAIRKERDRRYFEAIRETDPVKRARLMRRVNEPIDPAELEREAETPAPADAAKKEAGKETSPGFRVGRGRETVPGSIGRERNLESRPTGPTSRTPARMPLAGEPLTGLSAPARSADGGLSGIGSPTYDPLGMRPSTPTPSSIAAPRSPAARRRASLGPDRRPLLPSEAVDRNRKAAEAKPELGPSTGRSVPKPADATRRP